MSLEMPIEVVKAAIIRRMDGKSFLQPTGLIASLAQLSGEDPLAVRQTLARLAKMKWIEGVSQDGTPYAQVKILGEVPAKVIDPLQVGWEVAMRGEGFDDGEMRALLGCWKKLQGFDVAGMRAIAAGLKKIREEQSILAGQPVYLVSARYLMGSSKLLCAFPDKALIAFGIDTTAFPGHPPYVVAGGCAQPEIVVLIENPASFELAVTTQAAKRCAFVATYGFGLSNVASEYGNQLARLVESGFRDAVTLVRECSSCPSVKALLTHPTITFWGDLDPAGMQIYHRLKRKLPQLRLSAVYSWMAEEIAAGGGHPYVEATGKLGQSRMSTDAIGESAAGLLSVCGVRGLDQECVPIEQVERLITNFIGDQP